MDKAKFIFLIKKAAKSITLVRAVYGLVVIFLALSALWGWYRQPRIINVPQNVYVDVEKIKEVVKVKTEYIYVDKVQVLNKAEAIKKLDGLGAGIADDPNKEITSTGVIPAWKGRTNVVNVIDKKSGISEIMAKQVGLPLIAIEQERYAGVRITSKGSMSAFAEWNFLRLGSAHVGAYGSYSTDDSLEAGVQLKVEF